MLLLPSAADADGAADAAAPQACSAAAAARWLDDDATNVQAAFLRAVAVLLVVVGMWID
jgi:hypothetical protein